LDRLGQSSNFKRDVYSLGLIDVGDIAYRDRLLETLLFH
jgi:hypothetical protein